MKNYSQSFSSRTILVIGRRLMPFEVLTWTERTSPSSLVLTLSTTPSGQFPRDVDSSTTSTRSFGLRLEEVLVHLDRHCKAGRYSRSQRFQNTSERYCTWRHQRLVSVALFEDSRGKACLVVAAGEKHGWREWRRVWIVTGSYWSVVHDSFGLAQEGQ